MIDILVALILGFIFAGGVAILYACLKSASDDDDRNGRD